MHKVLMDIIFMCLSTYSLVAMIKTDNSGCISKTDNNKSSLGWNAFYTKLHTLQKLLFLQEIVEVIKATLLLDS